MAAQFSYKAAWDAVTALNNLLPTLDFVTTSGGRAGRGAEITEAGRKVIAAFHKWEDKLSHISSVIVETGLDEFENSLLWSVGVKISTRNVFQAISRSTAALPEFQLSCLRFVQHRLLDSNLSLNSLGDLRGAKSACTIAVEFGG